MARLHTIELHQLTLPMRRRIHTAGGLHDSRPVIYVSVETDEAIGWGECAALPNGTAVDPALEVVWEELVQAGMDRLFEAAKARDGELPPAFQVGSLFGSGPASRMAGAALEMAVLDAELVAKGQSLAERLGAGRAEVPVGSLVGIPANRDLSSLLRAAETALDEGSARLRVKIEPGWDEEPVVALRRHFPELTLQVDANGSYRWEGIEDGLTDARRLAALDEYELGCIEQPLPQMDLPAHAALGELLATPICLDESLSSRRRVVDAIRYGACRAACLKPGRLGGLFAAQQVVALCREAEVSAFMGGFFETSLGRSANLALAGLEGFDLAGDLSAPSGYLEEQPFGAPAYPAVEDGLATVPRSPGVGPRPAQTLLERQRERHERRRREW